MSGLYKPYAECFKEPAGPGDKRPTALQIVEDNHMMNKCQGRVAFVTGGTSGLGFETVRALHATGADVFFTARDADKGEATRRSILASSKAEGRLEVIEMDMDSLESVRKAAHNFLSQSEQLHILVNNAGIMNVPYGRTEDGFERQFGVNHLAHYLLTRLLLPTLELSSTPQHNSRVVFVSSTAHRWSQIIWDNYNFDKPGSYDASMAYSQSKTANIWTANYIDRAFGPLGVHALSLHPGGIWTGLQTYLDPKAVELWKSNPEATKTMSSTEQGAATTIWAALGRVWEGKGGEYLSECSIATTTTDLATLNHPGAAPFVHDKTSEDQLWELSAKLVST